uniref:Uncharacterized protein n=1 Tax=Romanomermis culicivorax TaxID=13658 RepID=A0A915HTA4_ROMCU
MLAQILREAVSILRKTMNIAHWAGRLAQMTSPKKGSVAMRPKSAAPGQTGWHDAHVYPIFLQLPTSICLSMCQIDARQP